LNERLFLTRGLVAHVSTHPDVSQGEFQALAGALIAEKNGIRSIQLARNTVVSHLYPLEGNEKAQGLRLLELPAQRAAVLRALETKNTVVAGPVDLVQGGVAFVSRTPIYLTPPGGPPGGGRYWGLATVLVDKDTLLKKAGLFDDAAALQYALRGKDGLGAQGGVFFGDPAIFESSPVVLDIYLPNGSWQLGAIPVGGWAALSPRLGIFRFGGGFLALLAGGLAFLATHHHRRRAHEALKQQHAFLRQVIDVDPNFIFAKDREGRFTLVNQAVADAYGTAVEDLIGKTDADFNPNLDEVTFFRRIDLEVMDTLQERFIPEERITDAQGKVRWLQTVKRPIVSQDGKAHQVLGSATDITQRKRAEEELLKSEAAVRKSQEDLQALAGKLLTAQEEERRRLARELHDDFTQRLAVLAIEAAKLEQQLEGSPEPVLGTLRQIKEQIVKLSADVHAVSRQLHPSILDDLGLVTAMESECANFAQREGIAVKYEPHNLPATLPRDVALSLYRITQEALRNIAKHAETKEAYVTLAATEDTIVLSIWDDGVGFDPAAVRRKPGLGLVSMEERVRLIQGELSLNSQPGRGTVIEVRVPLLRRAR
jgi:PAS domain S-box-containing protein